MSPLGRVLLDAVILHPASNHVLVRRNGSASELPQVRVSTAAHSPREGITPAVEQAIAEECAVAGRLRSLVRTPKAPGVLNALAAYEATDRGKATDLEARGFEWKSVETLLSQTGESQRQCIQDAVNVIQIGELGSLYSKAFVDGMPTAATFLLQRTNEIDNRFGWSQLLDRTHLGALSTAQGVLAIVNTRTQTPDLGRAVETIQAFQNTDGGWPVRHALIGLSERSITESTLFCIWALLDAGVNDDDPAIVRAFEWLDDLQRPDGGWGSSLNSDRSRTYPTAFAARIYQRVKPNSTRLADAILWLKSAQGLDGGWPALRDATKARYSSSTPIHTAHAIIALLGQGSVDSRDEMIESGLNYLDETLREGDREPWASTSEVEVVDHNAALDYRHFTTPWVLIALLEAGRSPSHPTSAAAARWLIGEQQTLGYWTCVLTPGQTPIWATHDALLGIKTLQDSVLSRTADLLSSEYRERESHLGWHSAMDSIEHTQFGELRRSSKLMFGWNIALTILVTITLFLALKSAGLDITPALRFFGSIGVGFIAGFGPFIYQLISQRIESKGAP